jgi:hypothetical protein
MSSANLQRLVFGRFDPGGASQQIDGARDTSAGAREQLDGSGFKTGALDSDLTQLVLQIRFNLQYPFEVVQLPYLTRAPVIARPMPGQKCSAKALLSLRKSFSDNNSIFFARSKMGQRLQRDFSCSVLR